MRIDGFANDMAPRNAALDRKLKNGFTHFWRDLKCHVLLFHEITCKRNGHTQAQAQHQAEYSRHVADIEASWRSMPFFDSLRPVMTKLAQSGKAHTVKQAYDMALKANPTVAMSAEIARRDAVRDRQMGRGKRR